MLVWKLLCNLIRFVWAKLRFGGRYKSCWIERIHNSVDIRLYGKSRIEIGRNVEISKDAELWCFDDAQLQIGDGCYFNSRLMISCHTGVTIGKGCMFGPDVKIFDNNHKFSALHGVSSKLSAAPVRIGKHCWIASNVVILKGTIIGDNCVVGAGCVVSGIIPNGSIMMLKAGNIITERIS